MYRLSRGDRERAETPPPLALCCDKWEEPPACWRPTDRHHRTLNSSHCSLCGGTRTVYIVGCMAVTQLLPGPDTWSGGVVVQQDTGAGAGHDGDR